MCFVRDAGWIMGLVRSRVLWMYNNFAVACDNRYLCMCDNSYHRICNRIICTTLNYETLSSDDCGRWSYSILCIGYTSGSCRDRLDIGMTGYMSYMSPLAVVYSVIWGGVIMLPFIWLPCRLRWMQLIMFSVLVIFNTVNCLYYRNFGCFVPLRALGMWQGINIFTLEAARSSLTYADVIIWIALLAQVVLYCLLRHPIKTLRFGRKFTLCISLGVGFTLCLLLGWRYKAYLAPPAAYADEFKSIDSFAALTGTMSDFDRKGYFEMYALQLVDMLRKQPLLTQGEIQEIRELLKRSYDIDDVFTDSVTSNNRGKNLVFIVVESLNSSALGHSADGVRMTPVLDSIIASDDVICFDNMRSQAMLGESSDGQLIYNTGMYPLVDQITLSVERCGPYPSLCRELSDYYSLECIGEDKDVWFHEESSRAYGYHKLIDNLRVHGELSEDEAILAASLREIRNIKRPFFAFITTIAMHMPFDEDDVIPRDWTLSDRAYGYVSKTSVFDQALGRFIAGIKDAGLYDDTVIVIASDHQVPLGSVMDDAIDDGRIMLIIINSGLQGKVDSRIVG